MFILYAIEKVDATNNPITKFYYIFKNKSINLLFFSVHVNSVNSRKLLKHILENSWNIYRSCADTTGIVPCRYRNQSNGSPIHRYGARLCVIKYDNEVARLCVPSCLFCIFWRISNGHQPGWEVQIKRCFARASFVCSGVSVISNCNRSSVSDCKSHEHWIP